MKFTSENDTCVTCQTVGIDYHHLKSKKSGGCNCGHNLISLCRAHHVEIHKIGRNTFVKKHKLETYLKFKGWLHESGKWFFGGKCNAQ